MAGNVKIQNANGKTVTLQNPDTNLADVTVDTSKIAIVGATGGTGSAGAGKQYVELKINGVTYKVLHDGTL